VELVLQTSHLSRDLLHPRKRNYTNVTVLQCDGIAPVALFPNAVDAEDIARYVKPHDLFASIVKDELILERATTDSIDSAERIPCSVETLATPNLAASTHDLVNALEFIGRKAER